MNNPLRALFPRSEKHLLMGRLAPTSPSPALLTGVAVQTLSDPVEPGAAALDAFAADNAFPSGWVGEMLAESARATVAKDRATDEILAMAWTTSHKFHVEEIGATFDPGAGVYLFGDFVAPQHRGRRLQRFLINHRIGNLNGAPYACTLVHPANAASLRSYTHEGFSACAQFLRNHWRSRSWARCKPFPHAAVSFKLESPEIVIAYRT